MSIAEHQLFGHCRLEMTGFARTRRGEKMDDLISRQSAIEAVALACIHMEYKTWNRCSHEIAHIIQQILDLEKRRFGEGRKDG